MTTSAAHIASAKAGRRSLVEVARDLHPLLAAQSAANEAKGSLTDETIRALWDGGFFGMWMPRCFGGIEAGPLEALGTSNNCPIRTVRPAGSSWPRKWRWAPRRLFAAATAQDPVRQGTLAGGRGAGRVQTVRASSSATASGSPANGGTAADCCTPTGFTPAPRHCQRRAAYVPGGETP